MQKNLGCSFLLVLFPEQWLWLWCGSGTMWVYAYTALLNGVARVDEGPSTHKAIDTCVLLLHCLEMRLSKYSADVIRQPAYCASSSFRATIEDPHNMFIAPIQLTPDVHSRGRASLLDSGSHCRCCLHLDLYYWSAMLTKSRMYIAT